MALNSKTKTTNKVLFDTIRDLKKLSNKTGENVWKAVAEKLSASASQRAPVNLLKIDKLTKEKDCIIVPGKVLGDGNLSKKITIIAFAFSETAKAEIEKSKSKYMTIRDYISKNPSNNIKIIG